MRQIILDTETTGLETALGHRIIEVAAVELLNRRFTGKHFHYYCNPDREIDAGAQAIHGISQEFLTDKPRFSQILPEFLDFIDGAELVIHNANFDIGFLNYELALANHSLANLRDHHRVIDTLILAREKHPGQKNNLDALCKRYSIDNSHRELHGALLDAKLLALVYLAMTGGQDSLFTDNSLANTPAAATLKITRDMSPLTIIKANPEELLAHEEYLALLAKDAEGGSSLWQKLESENAS